MGIFKTGRYCQLFLVVSVNNNGFIDTNVKQCRGKQIKSYGGGGGGA